MVYSINTLDCDAVSGGERGRLVWAATQLATTSIAQRLQFFADADFDRLLQRTNPSNMILTDGRDLESYCFLGNCCDHVCGVVRPGDPNLHTVFKQLVTALARPLGILRLSSERHDLALPFRRTLEKGLGRFVLANGTSFKLDIDAVIRSLLQNAGRSLPDLEEVKRQYEEEFATANSVPDNQIVHGKDLARVVSWKFDIPQSFAENYIMLALATETSAIRNEPNIQVASNWLN